MIKKLLDTTPTQVYNSDINNEAHVVNMTINTQETATVNQDDKINTAQYVPVLTDGMTIAQMGDECEKKYGTTQTYFRTMEGDDLVIYFMMTMNFEGQKMRVYCKEIIKPGDIEPDVVQSIPEGLERISIDEYHSILEWANI